MKRFIKISAMLLIVTALFASCMEDADNDVTYYSDTAIISFSVTNFNTYHKTISSKGEDSTYMVKEDGARYKFYIDQSKNEIYNTDSLPIGTDARHLICAIGTARGGNVLIKSPTSDSLSVILMSDSLDFTNERTLKVFSLDGKYDRTYKVKVNVHKELADQFVWNMYGTNDAFATSEDMKLVARGTDLVAFVKNNDVTSVYKSSINNPGKWDKQPVTFDGEAYTNAITSDGRLYIMSEGRIYSSESASEWKEESSSSDVVRLVGSNRTNIYAIGKEGIISSDDACHTWKSEVLEDGLQLLPESEISFTSTPLITNKGIDRIAIIGNRNVESDKDAVVWSRLTEYNPTTERYSWNYIEQTDNLKFRLPRLRGLKVIPYAGGLYAMGGEPYDYSMNPFNQIYFSKDGGITWLRDKRFTFPYRFISDNSFGITVDEEHHIWLLCGKTGQIWRGRLNGLAWENK